MTFKQIILASAVLAGANAFADVTSADQSAQFSYPAAAAAFATATAPAQSNLVGQWMMVGQASSPDQDQSTDGYWPNGEYTIAGDSGYFKGLVTIAPVADAFGNVSLEFTEQRVGVETGHIYDTNGPYAGAVVSADGYQFDAPDTPGYCADAYDCRMLAAQGMLLCSVTVDDLSQGCGRFSQVNPYMYVGFIQVPAPPPAPTSSSN